LRSRGRHGELRIGKQTMIRHAEVKDIPRIAEILVFGKRMAYRDIFRDDFVSFNEIQVLPLARELEKDPARLAGMRVYDDGIVKGVLAFDVSGREIMDFYVEPFFTGQGIGSALLMHLFAEFPGEMRLFVVNANAGAKRFYEKHGFVPTGFTQKVPGTEQLEAEYCRQGP